MRQLADGSRQITAVRQRAYRPFSRRSENARPQRLDRQRQRPHGLANHERRRIDRLQPAQSPQTARWMATSACPAVSFLEACPTPAFTPAHVDACQRAPAFQIWTPHCRPEDSLDHRAMAALIPLTVLQQSQVRSALQARSLLLQGRDQRTGHRARRCAAFEHQCSQRLFDASKIGQFAAHVQELRFSERSRFVAMCAVVQ